MRVLNRACGRRLLLPDVELLRHGGRMTIGALIVDLRPQLLAYARSIADSHDDADELVADAIERCLRAPSPPDAKDALKFWMFRTIRNLSIDELRKRRVRREYSERLGRHSGEIAHAVAGAEETVPVRLAFEQLKPYEREILFLVDVMGMTYAEAAEVISVPVGTVMSRVSRARRALLERLDPTAADKRRGNDRAREL